MTTVKKEKKQDSVPELKQQILELSKRLVAQQDLANLENKAYATYQILFSLNRIAEANERQAKALEESLQSSEETEEEPEEKSDESVED